MNYIYGTWSVLCALNAAGIGASAPEFVKAIAWLLSIQNLDGGWVKTPQATGSTIAAMSARRARPPRPPGPYWASWRRARSSIPSCNAA